MTQILDLSGNNISDDGMCSLADAFSKGALPALEYAPGLVGNPASDAAKQAVEDAFESRGVDEYDDEEMATLMHNDLY